MSAEGLWLTFFALASGAYHFPDFQRDPEIRSKPSSWTRKQAPVILYCLLHVFGAILFYYWFYPIIEGELAPTSKVRALALSLPEFSRPAASFLFYLAILRGRVWTTITPKGPFYFGPKEISEGIRRGLREFILNAKTHQEENMARAARKYLSSRFPNRLDLQASALNEVQARILNGRLRAEDRLKYHLMGKWAQYQDDLGKTGNHGLFVAHAADALVAYFGSWEELERLLGDASLTLDQGPGSLASSG